MWMLSLAFTMVMTLITIGMLISSPMVYIAIIVAMCAMVLSLSVRIVWTCIKFSINIVFIFIAIMLIFAATIMK